MPCAFCVQNPSVVYEADDRSKFYKESTRYNFSTKLKHRLLYRLGYCVHHVPYYEWNKVCVEPLAREYLLKLLRQSFPQVGSQSEWLDPDDAHTV